MDQDKYEKLENVLLPVIIDALKDQIEKRSRKWFQGDHYDITQSKRALAVQAGAKEVSLRDLAKMAITRRREAAAKMRRGRNE